MIIFRILKTFFISLFSLLMLATLIVAFTLYHPSQQGKHLISKDYADEMYSSYKSKFIEIEGVRIHYRDEGEGEPLLLIHGLIGSLHSWRDWTDVLQDDYRLITLDLPGFGLSGFSETLAQKHPGIDLYVLIVEKFLAELNIDCLHVAGSSMGGWVTWELAAQNPTLVNKVVLLNAAGYLTQETKPAGVRLLQRPVAQKLLDTGIPKVMMRQMLRKAFKDKSKMSAEMLRRRYELTNREGNIEALFTMITAPTKPNIERIASIEQPTLILWGEHDRIIDIAYAHRFACDIKNSELIIYPNVGHIPCAEVPKRSAIDVKNFLQN